MTEQLYRVEYAPQPGATIQLSTVRDLTRRKAEARAAEALPVGSAAIKLDSLHTTIRAFCSDNPRILGAAYDEMIDRPCVARVLDNETRVFCGGRAVVGFYFDDPFRAATVRPAYLSLDDSGSVRLVFSA